MGKLLRIAASIIAAPLLVVVYLNVEVMAAAMGWDGLLLKALPPMLEVLTQPWAFAVSAFFVGLSCGAWLHWLTVRKTAPQTELPEVSQQLEVVANQKFHKNSVQLDGKRFINCEFDDVMVVWDGGPYTLEHCKIEPSRVSGFMTNSHKISEQMHLYGLLGLLHPKGTMAMGIPLSSLDKKMLEAVGGSVRAEDPTPE